MAICLNLIHILFGWKELDRWYYGVRYARGCHPDDLWTKYFTSSKIVKEYREKYGEPDVIEVRQIFDDSFQAREWEHRIIDKMKMCQSIRWLNRGNGQPPGIAWNKGLTKDTDARLKLMNYNPWCRGVDERHR